VEERGNLPPPGPAAVAEASGASLSAVLGQLPEGVVVVGAGGRLVYANGAAAWLLGLDPPGHGSGPAGPEPGFRVRDGDGRELPAERMPAARALAGERFDDLDCLLELADGTTRRVRCAGGPVELEGGEAGAWVSLRDVGREESILRELREERDLVAALVDQSPLAVAVVRAPDLVIELANDVARSLAPEVRMAGTDVGRVFPRPGRPGSSTSSARSPPPAGR